MHIAAYIPDTYKQEIEELMQKLNMNQSQFVRALIIDALRRNKCSTSLKV